MKFTVYDAATGEPVKVLTTSANNLDRNVGEGERVYLGEINFRTHRIDPDTGEPVARDEPLEFPYEVRAKILLEIRLLERAQARPLRELALDASNRVARDKAAEIEAKIAVLRDRL